MKKIILTAALAIAAIGSAIAASSVTHNGSLAVTVNDYITMVPNGPFAAGPIVFSTPQEQVDGWTWEGQVEIVASRAWKYEYSASDFVRSNATPAGPGVATTVPAGNIWKVGTSGGSTGVNTTGGRIPTSNSLTNMANQATGTLLSTFTLSAELTPGLTNQMSGTYTSTIHQIASLQ